MVIFLNMSVYQASFEQMRRCQLCQSGCLGLQEQTSGNTGRPISQTFLARMMYFGQHLLQCELLQLVARETRITEGHLHLVLR